MGGRSQKSDIFIKHFDKVALPSGDLQAICKYCSKAYKWKHGGGYDTLIRHIEKNHPVKIGISRYQSQIPTFSSQSGNESQLFKFSESDFRDETARFVAVEQLSFSFGDKLSFQNWLSSSANPAIRRISRNTLKRTIHKLVATQKKELIKEFASLDNKVSLCSDIWSDHWQSCSYMGITCHWIDNAWNIQKRLLAYRCFNDPHTAILEEYGLTSKIFSISFDNASANTCSIDELIRICQPSIGGKFFHIRCTCHILNLCVQDGLRSLETYIKPIRTAIHYLWTHPQVMKQWGRFCKANGMRAKRFARDVPTRWNSTYKLLLSIFQYKELLCGFFGQVVQSSSLYLFSNQWNICTTICEILKVFSDATDQLSGVYYPTCHLVVTHLCNVACIFCEHLNSNEPPLIECIISMKTKWEKYFLNIPEIFLSTSTELM
ncbi:hypothetical protein F511_18122 [Dorcoceras hygrometricum]|uniref:BED-type domain-containing protein n=1 Tax=Dorcoceras hygrometricum TaxID=472368 RepID=A0A2Z7BFV5_9LAMI|nr:hypothetical protein F511_18122 [Dorcoceras hygrometricum]